MDLAWSSVESLTLIRPVNPQGLTSSRICSNGKAALVHREVKNAVDHDGSRLAAGLRIRDKAVGFPDPCDLQILDVVAVNLIQRRIESSPVFGAIGAPL